MGSILSPKVDKPVITPPAVMPTMDDAAIRAAKKKQTQAIMQRSGREGTILTDYGNTGNGDKLG